MFNIGDTARASKNGQEKMGRISCTSINFKYPEKSIYEVQFSSGEITMCKAGDLKNA